MKITYSITEKARDAQWVQGNITGLEQALEVDWAALTAAQRKELLAAGTISPRGDSLSLNRPYTNFEAPRPAYTAVDIEGLVAEVTAFNRALQQWERDKEAQKKTREALHAGIKKKTQELERRYAAMGPFTLKHKHYVDSGKVSLTITGRGASHEHWSDSLEDFHALLEGTEEFTAQILEPWAKRAEEKEQQEVLKRGKERECIAWEERLQTWAKSNGSEKLRLLLELGQDWKKTAQQEYLVSRVPKGFIPDAFTTTGWNVEGNELTMDDLRALKEVREQYPDQEFELKGFTEEEYAGEEETYICLWTRMRSPNSPAVDFVMDFTKTLRRYMNEKED